MLSRRHLMQWAGLGGMLGGPLLVACEGKRVDVVPTLDPLPDDPNKPWWLRKNFAPVEESEAFDLTVIGALPPSLDGLYLRNGPNPKGYDSGHWFLGDGMVHGVRLEKGKAPWYRARYVQTPVLGDPDGGNPLSLTDHQANTSVLAHWGRLFCLEEIGLPYELSPDDLSTIGPFDFDGKLVTPMTAHPKIDPVTGELWFFAYGVLDPVVYLHRVAPDGTLVESREIDLPAAVMMHDFQVTPTHVVFMDLPILFDFDLAMAGDPFPFRWAPENGARLGVVPREGGEASWVEIEPCFVFHTFNAFHDPSDDGVIHLDGVRYPTMWEKGSSDFSNAGRPHRFSIDLASETVSLAELDDKMVEFPRINPARQGLAHRLGYAVASSASGQDGEIPAMDQVVKFDLQTGERIIHQLPAGQEVDEAMFVADPAASAEDDGWLLAYVFDHADHRSRLLVVDASAMSEVARVELPTRVPHGFHGDFLPSSS